MGAALMWSALCTFAVICGLGVLTAVGPARGMWRPCDRCGAQVMERWRVVKEYPEDPLYPVSVELVCEQCATSG